MQNTDNEPRHINTRKEDLWFPGPVVLNGAVYDAQGFYPTNAWIRNPVPAWQSWGARAGTLVYYKNGHFADSANPGSS